MMQWLRDHTKHIMVVVVLMAMLAFIGDQALFNLISANDSDSKYAKILGKTVRTSDVYRSDQDLQILRPLGFQINFVGNEELTAQDFYMLVAEARAAGLKASQAEIDQELKARNATADQLAMMQPRNLWSPTNVYEAVGNYILINKNAERVLRAAVPSDAEVRHYAVDTEDRAKVKAVVFDASKFVDANEAIPEAEIQAQFDKYKNTIKGEGDDPYGYKHRDRVKLQCIVADFSKIESMINVSLEEASLHWRKNKSAYTITEQIPTSMPEAGAPLVQPESPGTSVTREKEFSEARAQVESEIRKRRAAQAGEQAMRKLSSELLKPWFQAPTDKATGYKTIPPAVKEPGYMQALRDQAATEFGIELEFMEVGPLTRAEIQQHPVLGKARVGGAEVGGMPLTEYAFRVPPLFKAKGDSDVTARLQLFQTPDAPLNLEGQPRYTVQQDAAGNPRLVAMPGDRTGLLLFRVVEALESGAPATVDEVRDQIVADLREERAYARMEDAARQLYTAARKVGLSDALAMDEPVKTKLEITAVETPNPFARKNGADLSPSTVGAIGQSEDFVTAVFSMAGSDWTPAEPEATATPDLPALTTQPAVSPAPKVALVNLPKLKKRVVVEFLEMNPLTQDRYDSQVRSSAYQQLFQRRARTVLTEWFTSANIQKRCGFQLLTTDNQPLPPEGIQAPPGDSQT